MSNGCIRSTLSALLLLCLPMKICAKYLQTGDHYRTELHQEFREALRVDRKPLCIVVMYLDRKRTDPPMLEGIALDFNVELLRKIDTRELTLRMLAS